MNLIKDIQSSGRLLREETNFIRGGLGLTITADNAIKKAFQRYANQFIDAAAEIATTEKENIPGKIRELKVFLI